MEPTAQQLQNRLDAAYGATGSSVWHLSTWGWDTENNTFKGSPPTLTIDGQKFTFDHPSQYLAKMEGLTGGPIEKFRKQLSPSTGTWADYGYDGQRATPTDVNAISNQEKIAQLRADGYVELPEGDYKQGDYSSEITSIGGSRYGIPSPSSTSLVESYQSKNLSSKFHEPMYGDAPEGTEPPTGELPEGAIGWFWYNGDWHPNYQYDIPETNFGNDIDRTAFQQTKLASLSSAQIEALPPDQRIEAYKAQGYVELPEGGYRQGDYEPGVMTIGSTRIGLPKGQGTAETAAATEERLRVQQETSDRIQNRILESTLQINEPRTIVYNGQEINLDAQGNIVGVKVAQPGSEGVQDGTIISSEYAPQTEEQLASYANPTGSNNIIDQGLTDSAAGTNTDGQFTPEQTQEILNTITDAESAIFNSDEFLALNTDQQDMLRQLFDVIAVNDETQAGQLLTAFEEARAISEPFFAQQIALTRDALERGFVSLDKEMEFKEFQLTNRIKELQEDVERQQEFLTLEEQSQMRGIQRKLEVDLDNTRNQMAARGMTFSSRKAEAEGLLNEVSGEMRESTARKFGQQQANIATQLARGQKSISADPNDGFISELERLRDLGGQAKLDIARDAESKLGSQIAGGLSNVPILGGIQGSINQNMSSDIMQGASNIFNRMQGQSSFIS